MDKPRHGSRNLNKQLPPEPASHGFTSFELMSVLVGPRKRAFRVNRRMLSDAVPFFRQKLQDPSPRPVIWLPSESSSMFALFVEWIHDRRSFQHLLKLKSSDAVHHGEKAARDLQWSLVRLHLFASHLSLYHLQDAAMDAVQDLYMSCNWDICPKLIVYLYTKCESLPSVRLRRWSVAMAAYSVAASTRNTNLQNMFEASPVENIFSLFELLDEFTTDYKMHMRNMHASRLDVRYKNPQLRIPANQMNNDERVYGFRQCSFHSHRAIVGEGPCPHDLEPHRRRSTDTGSVLDDNSSMMLDYHENTLSTVLSPPVPLFASEDNTARPWLSPGGSIPSTLNDGDSPRWR